jgi:hypothetical protein
MLVAKQKKKPNANGQIGMQRIWEPQDIGAMWTQF